MINAIFAIDSEGGLGKDNKLPWPSSKEDMQWFRLHTLNNIVVMGRKTWDSPDMPTPLPNRENWVITTNTTPFIKNQLANCHSNPIRLCEQLDQRHNKITWVIGGAGLLESMMGKYHRMYITRMFDNFNCDVHVNFDKMVEGYEKIYSRKYDTMEHMIYEAIPRPTKNRT